MRAPAGSRCQAPRARCRLRQPVSWGHRGCRWLRGPQRRGHRRPPCQAAAPPGPELQTRPQSNFRRPCHLPVAPAACSGLVTLEHMTSGGPAAGPGSVRPASAQLQCNAATRTAAHATQRHHEQGAGAVPHLLGCECVTDMPHLAHVAGRNNRQAHWAFVHAPSCLPPSRLHSKRLPDAVCSLRWLIAHSCFHKSSLFCWHRAYRCRLPLCGLSDSSAAFPYFAGTALPKK